MKKRKHGQFWLYRFWEKVNKTGECWIWIGTNHNTGYGKIKIDREDVLAHRLSWEIHNGKIPTNKHVLHTCDVRLCVNPRHLFLGTNEDNRQDMIRKNRAWWQKGKP